MDAWFSDPTKCGEGKTNLKLWTMEHLRRYVYIYMYIIYIYIYYSHKHTVVDHCSITGLWPIIHVRNHPMPQRIIRRVVATKGSDTVTRRYTTAQDRRNMDRLRPNHQNSKIYSQQLQLDVAKASAALTMNQEYQQILAGNDLKRWW